MSKINSASISPSQSGIGALCDHAAVESPDKELESIPLLVFDSSPGEPAIVFGDGSTHSRLHPLTKRRSEAAIPVAGNYRLIDAVVSNCINSDVTRIYALTQFNSTSLNSHLSRAYSGMRLSNDGIVEVIAAYQSPDNNGWFRGTADAIRRCLWMLEEYPVAEFLVLPGHHLYKMDYRNLVEAHRRSGCDITVSVSTRTKGDDRKEDMGIYVIDRDVMIELLTIHFPNANDLGSEVIPGATSLGMKIHTYEFDGYWEDMASIVAYYRANMEAIPRMSNAYNFYDKEWPLYTLPRHLPPTLITDAVITDSIVGDGCILNKCRITSSVIGMRTRIGNDAVVEDSIIIGSDAYYPNNNGSGEDRGAGIPVGIGEGSYIRKAIVDKNARIGNNVMIVNKDGVEEGSDESRGCIISGGVIVITRNALIPHGTIL
ncbi:inactive glucose-1-phosphate adenylyltransferase small subunit 2, chloroplastic-like isoform X2 [Andrographis paniculata]|uniref:inactive glucose-1-phosphate adenylyltransferase small subunit 2, chloroplastic-like isoform X2 n=1 Tax=Andrographis paniculata TaxID=175694 RepID=UPI0021E74810|nr:inactive glucose-1-phosphate adenylyltransferase small subunit 2, chloroplastic-like isoform X2 [Andrographis paniculata]